MFHMFHMFQMYLWEEVTATSFYCTVWTSSHPYCMRF